MTVKELKEILKDYHEESELEVRNGAGDFDCLHEIKILPRTWINQNNQKVNIIRLDVEWSER